MLRALWLVITFFTFVAMSSGVAQVFSGNAFGIYDLASGFLWLFFFFIITIYIRERAPVREVLNQ